MKIYPEKLASQLSSLAPVYVVGGEEWLLVEEAIDQIRLAARQQGYTEREKLHVDKGFDWSQLLMASASLSLFASKRLLEIRIPTSAPGKEGGQAITELANNPPPDTIVLVILGKLERGTRNSKWYKSLDQAGVSVECWPVDANRLPGWIKQRLQAKGLRPTPSAVELLCSRVEGNLLAAKQEIDKLSLSLSTNKSDQTNSGQTISDQDIADAVSSSARYDIFSLIDASLEGDIPRVARMLKGLQDEGAEPIMLNAMFTRELRTLADLRHKIDNGQNLNAVLNSVWGKRKPIVGNALKRYNSTRLQGLLLRAGQVDRIAKGAEFTSHSHAWHAFTNLVIATAGKPLFKYSSVDNHF